MARHAISISICVVVLAILAALWNGGSQDAAEATIRGQNNTVLFLTSEHGGMCNVHLATAYALAVRHPHIRVDYASLPKNGPRVERLHNRAKAVTPSSRGITFHPLNGVGYLMALPKAGLPNTAQESIMPLGMEGLTRLCKDMQHYISPWPAEDHYELYLSINKTIDELDPAFVVLDMVFGPAIDAVRDRNRAHAILTPNLLANMVPGVQPPYNMLWKWPALGSGIPFPVPWSQLPSNIWMNLRLIFSFVNMPDLKAKQAWLKSKGLRNPIDFMGLYRPNVPWLTQTLPGAHNPLDIIPANVIRTGPINLAGTESDGLEDTELVKWMRQAPTILINLGSGFSYIESEARMMLQAIKDVLRESDVQILWRMQRSKPEFDRSFVDQAIRDLGGRLRAEEWFEVEPPTLLNSGLVAVNVHHGGAGCFHDALGGGVPQVVMPMWVDLYNIAQLAEELGIGVWACRETSPAWTVDGISSAILKVLGSDPMRKKAAEFHEQTLRLGPGRDIAALEIANAAAMGY